MAHIPFILLRACFTFSLAYGLAKPTIVKDPGEGNPLCDDDPGSVDAALAEVSLLQTAIQLNPDTAKPGEPEALGTPLQTTSQLQTDTATPAVPLGPGAPLQMAMQMSLDAVKQPLVVPKPKVPYPPVAPGVPRLAFWLLGLLVSFLMLAGFLAVVRCCGFLKGKSDGKANKVQRTVIKGPAIFLNKATVVEGPIVFASGQLPVVPGPDGKPVLVDGGIKPQAERCLKNLAAVLAEAGTDLKHCLKVSIFLTDIADFTAFNEVYVKHFDDPDNAPARTAIAVAALPVPGAKVEIECMAAGKVK